MCRSLRSQVVFGAVLLALVAASARVAPAWLLRGGTNIYVPERQSVRCVFFGNTTVSGSYAIDWGAPAWSAEYEQGFDELTLGKRVRFGKDQWTTLDTSCALVIAGKEVKAGLYYCALERNKKGDFALVLLDPDEIRKARLDPFASESTRGGLLIPLAHAARNSKAAALMIEVVKESANEKEQTLTIAWGPHALTAQVKAKV